MQGVEKQLHPVLPLEQWPHKMHYENQVLDDPNGLTIGPRGMTESHPYFHLPTDHMEAAPIDQEAWEAMLTLICAHIKLKSTVETR